MTETVGRRSMLPWSSAIRCFGLTAFLVMASACPVWAAEESSADNSSADATAVTSATQQSPAQLQDITVKAKQPAARTPVDETYVAPAASTATRTSASLFETPASVQVIPAQVIDDQAVSRLKDVYRNVSGVHPAKTEGYATVFESAYVRGFAQNPYMEGVRTYAIPPIDLAGLDRVEVLKGPASILYGALEPGGIVNLVPKTPSFTQAYSVGGTFGSYDFYRGTFDANGLTNDDKTMALRFAGAYQHSDSFRDYLTDESFFFTPSIAWNPTDDTRITAWVWYQHLLRPLDDGVAFDHNGNPVAPISTHLGDPIHNKQKIDDVFIGGKLEHDFTHELTFRQQIQIHHFGAAFDAVRHFGTTTAADEIDSRFYDASTTNSWEFDSTSELIWKTQLAQMNHEVLFGVQLYRQDYTYHLRRDNNIDGAGIPITHSVDTPYSGGALDTFSTTHQKMNTAAFYIQDQIGLLDDKLHLLVGGRLDYVRQDSNGNTQDDLGPSWRVGALYQVTDWMAPYGNISHSFNPTSPGAGNNNPEPLDPETGMQYEGGVKFTFFDNRLNMTAAVYQITKQNVPIDDPPGSGFRINGGDQRSRGFEFDVLGQIAPGLQIIGNYTYTDTEILKSNSASLPEGTRFRNIPLNSGSVWLTYNFPKDTALQGLGFGAGVFASSKKTGDNTATFDLPGYYRVDAGAWYDLALDGGATMRFQLNINNLLDKEYYESSFHTGRVQPGEPLTVMGSVSILF